MARHEMRHGMRHAAMRQGGHATHSANRETRALNLLEAKGYGGSFSNFQREGHVYSATVMRHGQSQKVIINPERNSVTRQG